MFGFPLALFFSLSFTQSKKKKCFPSTKKKKSYVAIVQRIRSSEAFTGWHLKIALNLLLQQVVKISAVNAECQQCALEIALSYVLHPHQCPECLSYKPHTRIINLPFLTDAHMSRVVVKQLNLKKLFFLNRVAFFFDSWTCFFFINVPLHTSFPIQQSPPFKRLFYRGAGILLAAWRCFFFARRSVRDKTLRPSSHHQVRKKKNSNPLSSRLSGLL